MKHILLLDDDPDEPFLLKSAFEDLGMEITLQWFQTFESLCEYMSSTVSPPDMLFLDINLPRQSGVECLQQLRERDVYRQVPVIMYTNSEYIHNIDLSFSLGATVFLKKSSSMEALKRNLQMIVGWNLLAVLDWPVDERTLMSN